MESTVKRFVSLNANFPYVPLFFVDQYALRHHFMGHHNDGRQLTHILIAFLNRLQTAWLAQLVRVLAGVREFAGSISGLDTVFY